jgi:anti-sigma regulatory factor (Ser/Thr protein kinase)
MNSSEAVLDFRVRPEPHRSRGARDAIVDFARSNGVEGDDLAYFATAVGEALANAVEHARAEVPIAVEVRVAPDRIVALVQDSGVGFQSSLVADAELPEPDAERGRGLPIMRRCCHIFAMNSVPGKGTAVLLGRYFRNAEKSNAA